MGSIYQTANQLPNVVFEVAVGGALAAVAVPIIASQLAHDEQGAANRTASAMLTWALTLLIPLSILMAVVAAPLAMLLVGRNSCSGSTDLMTSMLVVFAPQIALYGVGIVLAGVLQAHRRFLAAAMAPLLSSVMAILAYLSYAALAQGQGNHLARLPSHASMALAAGTTLGVAALSLPLLVPVHRAGIRLRPTWTFPNGVARRAMALAGAGLTALVAQQFTVLVTMWVSEHRGGIGTLNVYTYVQAVYLLPYAVLAVPVATAAFPALAGGSPPASLTGGPAPAALAAGSPPATSMGGSATELTAGSNQQVRATGADTALDERAQRTLAASARAIVVATCVGAAVLVAIASPTGAFFSALDAGRNNPAGQEALAAMPGAMISFAPGLVGFGLLALLARAMYVKGRPAVAGAWVAAGWLIAAVVPLVVLQDGDGPRKTLQLLGLSSSVGMTVGAIGLALGVRRTWGAHAFEGFGRSAFVAAAAGGVAAAGGSAIAEGLNPQGLWAGAAVALLVAMAVLTFCAVSIWVGDNDAARLVSAKVRRRER
jgi:putative peptidoglycan lipid II flippase